MTCVRWSRSVVKRSFTKAAAKLGVSQSALSQTIRQLEARLGRPPYYPHNAQRVADRSWRASLTDRGAAVRRNRRGACDHCRAAGEAGWNHPHYGDRVRHPVRAGAEARQLLREYPDIKVEMTVDYGLSDIVAERYDAGVQQRGAGREGHDRGAHRAGPPDGRRRRIVILQE